MILSCGHSAADSALPPLKTWVRTIWSAFCLKRAPKSPVGGMGKCVPHIRRRVVGEAAGRSVSRLWLPGIRQAANLRCCTMPSEKICQIQAGNFPTTDLPVFFRIPECVSLHPDRVCPLPYQGNVCRCFGCVLSDQGTMRQVRLLVVADDGVGAVFIRFVKFVPRGKTRFRQGLPQTAAGLLYARNALC